MARPTATTHCVYIVRCADRSLYTGYARDPTARVELHNAGRGARYTAGRRPVRLVYVEVFAAISDALRREYQLKRLPKAEKEALVASAIDRSSGRRRPGGRVVQRVCR
jgi:putative endonuclease